MSGLLAGEIFKTCVNDATLKALLPIDTRPEMMKLAVYQGAINDVLPPVKPFIVYTCLDENPRPFYVEDGARWATEQFDFQIVSNGRDQSALAQILAALDNLFDDGSIALLDPTLKKAVCYNSRRVAPATPVAWDAKLEAMYGLYRYAFEVAHGTS